MTSASRALKLGLADCLKMGQTPNPAPSPTTAFCTLSKGAPSHPNHMRTHLTKSYGLELDYPAKDCTSVVQIPICWGQPFFFCFLYHGSRPRSGRSTELQVKESVEGALSSTHVQIPQSQGNPQQRTSSLHPTVLQGLDAQSASDLNIKPTGDLDSQRFESLGFQLRFLQLRFGVAISLTFCDFTNLFFSFEASFCDLAVWSSKQQGGLAASLVMQMLEVLGVLGQRSPDAPVQHGDC